MELHRVLIRPHALACVRRDTGVLQTPRLLSSFRVDQCPCIALAAPRCPFWSRLGSTLLAGQQTKLEPPQLHATAASIAWAVLNCLAQVVGTDVPFASAARYVMGHVLLATTAAKGPQVLFDF